MTQLRQKELQKASEIEPQNKTVLSQTAEIAISEGDFERALQIAKTLITLSPESTSAKLFLASIYAQNGNIAEAGKL